jgi:hypothetical protein
MIAQRIHIEPNQKAELQRLAEARGRSMAAEIREAIDRHLGEEPGSDDTEVAEIDIVGQEAQAALEAMCLDLDAAQAKLVAVLGEIDRLRTTAP